jgi:hypothetical protein
LTCTVGVVGKPEPAVEATAIESIEASKKAFMSLLCVAPAGGLVAPRFAAPGILAGAGAHYAFYNNGNDYQTDEQIAVDTTVAQTQYPNQDTSANMGTGYGTTGRSLASLYAEIVALGDFRQSSRPADYFTRQANGAERFDVPKTSPRKLDQDISARLVLKKHVA